MANPMLFPALCCIRSQSITVSQAVLTLMPRHYHGFTKFHVASALLVFYTVTRLSYDFGWLSCVFCSYSLLLVGVGAWVG